MKHGERKVRRSGRKRVAVQVTTGSMSPELLSKVRLVGAYLGIGKAAVLDRFALPHIAKILRRLESGKGIELGENGGA